MARSAAPPIAVHPGRRHPLGATPDDEGVNFSVFSRHATGVELLLYAGADAPRPFRTIRLDPAVHRTFGTWHVYVEGLRPGTAYTYRVDGPGDTERTGHRFDRRRELLDPWARAVSSAVWNRTTAVRRPASRSAFRAIVVRDDDYDWEDDWPIDLPLEGAVVYEMHVGGFTRHPSSGVAHPGTFAGLVEKIPYLVDLGITHVELLPVMAFDEQDVSDGARRRGLRNLWGYCTVGFWAPHPGYSATPDAGTARREFRDLVKALHRAGIGVILDVVFNHTAEDGEDGPTIHFKGLANETFYHLDPRDRRWYRDWSGCGNTLSCNHPFVAVFIQDCLESWVRDFHVDGFRFDLASVLTRGENGDPLHNAPVVWGIELSDELAGAKLIAEAWDAGGLYQVGASPGYRWAEWNGRYRDVVRRAVRGDRGLVAELATRIAGSSDLYEPADRLPINSVNFVTCHDGFTLLDLVSHERKHNEENGEESRDGLDENLSWNGGVEGESSDPGILARRRRDARNLVAILLLSQGVPMILAGDEVLRTQRGNNNAYCQDNEIGWLDWRLLETNREMLRFVRGMIAFRRRHACLMRRRFLTGKRPDGARLPDVAWHGKRLGEPAWGDPDARMLAFTLGGRTEEEEDVHVVLNLDDAPLEAPLPPVEGRRWHVAVDTSAASPGDVVPSAEQRPVPGTSYRVAPRTVLVLEAR